MPLEVRLHRRQKLLAYASEAPILARGLMDAGWGVVPLAEGEGIIANVGDLANLRTCAVPFGGVGYSWHGEMGAEAAHGGGRIERIP
jgi:hypothetical protein